ncbi:hypothetical protein DL98DRAFT_590671 [Cadophora sp. DSE1049]|nr:hypothetical protein DL98DRAFT_590671 [Cadophora sp. DSE1049]
MAVTTSTCRHQLQSANYHKEWESNAGSHPGSRSDYASSISSVGCKTPPWESISSASHYVATYDYDLSCECAPLGCGVRFQPERFEEWIAHSVSHFKGFPLPSYAVCTFCKGEESSFRNDWDKELNWRERMIHIGGHLAKRVSNEIRSDFWVLEHLKTLDLISNDNYAYGLKHSVKPLPRRQANTPREAYLLQKEARGQGPWIEYNTRAESKSKAASRHVSRGEDVQSDSKARLRARFKDMSLEDLLELRSQRQLRKTKQSLSESGQKELREGLGKHVIVSTDEWPSVQNPKPRQSTNSIYQKFTTTSLKAQYLPGYAVSGECSVKEHHLTASQSTSVVDRSMSDSDTESTFSAESLDWDNDRIDFIYPRYTEPKDVRQELPSAVRLSPEAATAVDCIMREFLVNIRH